MKTRLIALVSLIVCCACNAFKDNGPDLTEIQKRIERLETGVRNAEAFRAVKRLQYAYGHYSEMGLWHDFADLFADNGVGHYPAGALDREGIRRLFLKEVGGGKLGLDEGRLYIHFMMEPVVTLAPDGKTARGRWRVLAMMGTYGESAVWAGGIYENTYILENGTWKIQDLHFYSTFSGRYEDPGWTVHNEEIPIHYTPGEAGNTTQESSDILPTTESPASPAVLNEQLDTLIWRAELLRDEDEITNLQNIYGYYVDRKMWDDVADLFAVNATMRMGNRGVYVGEKSIRRALLHFDSKGLHKGEINEHLQLQTIVSVASDRRTARARGVELVLSGGGGRDGLIGENIFENEYVREDGIWKIQSMRLYPRLLSDYDKGWAKSAVNAPGPNSDFPPDQLPSDTYKSFPGFQIPPFHFANPATGLPPRYPDTTAPSGDVPRLNPSDDVSANNHATAATKDKLADRIAEVERQLKILNGYSATENIAGAYGYYLDEALWDETADLFAVDARRDLSTIGVEVGRETIRASLKSRYPGGKSKDFFTAHQLIQPVIHVAPDGGSAKMRVRLFQLGGASSQSGFWLAGMYETSTIIEDGVWKFRTMDLDYTWTADYRTGWANVDDNTRGIISTPFPRIIDLPFHYRNPVTGRTPPLFVP